MLQLVNINNTWPRVQYNHQMILRIYERINKGKLILCIFSRNRKKRYGKSGCTSAQQRRVLINHTTNHSWRRRRIIKIRWKSITFRPSSENRKVQWIKPNIKPYIWIPIPTLYRFSQKINKMSLTIINDSLDGCNCTPIQCRKKNRNAIRNKSP